MPKPTMPIGTSATIALRPIDPQLRPCRTFTGVIGGRPPPPLPAVGLPAAGVAFFAAAPEPAFFAPAAGRVDGRRLPPVCGLLMLMPDPQRSWQPSAAVRREAHTRCNSDS